MKYQIVRYDETNLVMYVKVTQGADFSQEPVLAVSLINITTMLELETAIYSAWYANRPIRERATLTAEVETYVKTVINHSRNFSPEAEQLMQQQGITDSALSSTATTEATVI